MAQQSAIRGKILSIQMLRAVAAIMVVVFHARGSVREILNSPIARFDGLGAAGVDAFFVISGAIIYYTAFGGRRMPAAEFMIRRLERIVPIYFVVTLAWVPIAIFTGHQDAFTLPSLATTLTFVPIWSVAHFTSPVLGVGWTLNFEMFFYEAAALVLMSRKFIPVVFVSFAAAWMVRVATNWVPLQFYGSPMALEFLGGFLAMAWASKRALDVRWTGVVLGGIAIAWLITSAPPPEFSDGTLIFEGQTALLRPLIWGIPFVLLLISAMSFEPFIKGPWSKPALLLGDASYSIYLVHSPLLEIAVKLSKQSRLELPGALLLLLLSVSTILVGVVVHLMVERPALRLIRSLWAPTPAPAIS